MNTSLSTLHWRALLSITLLGLVGCATTQQNPIKAVWALPADAWSRGTVTGLSLRQKDGTIRAVPADKARTLTTVKQRMETVSPVRAELAIVETDTPNAFAFHHQGRQTIAFSLSWLDQLGHDADAIAVTMGHEFAHLHLGHSGAARKEREDTARGVSNVLGTILNVAGVPFGGTIAGLGVTAVARSFTRDEERAADELGLQWAIGAGFDACGKARAVAMYQRMRSGSLDIPFLSTHPSYGERSDLANDISMRTKGRGCGD